MLTIGYLPALSLCLPAALGLCMWTASKGLQVHVLPIPFLITELSFTMPWFSMFLFQVLFSTLFGPPLIFLSLLSDSFMNSLINFLVNLLKMCSVLFLLYKVVHE